LRIGGLLVGSAAAVAMGLTVGLAGCTSVTGGSPTVGAGEGQLYRASISASVASSSARESERQASSTTKAVHTTCETLSTTSADAIDAVNAYVHAFNQGGSVGDTEGPAVDSLNQSADAVEGSITDAIPQDLKDAFNAWVDGARATASAITGHASPGEFNQTIGQLNDNRSTALKLCDATY